MVTAIVSGALANKPGNGGNVWTRLGWALGLQRLGYRVVFVEQIERDAGPSHRAYFEVVMKRFGLQAGCALIDANGDAIWGLDGARLRREAEGADLLLNISGHLTVEHLKAAPACKIYYDDDPGYTQFWYASGVDRDRLAGHDAYFTLGFNIGTAACDIPTLDIHWRPVRPPVVLDEWPWAGNDGLQAGFTTVASWRGPYGPVTFAGTSYGQKAHEFRGFWDLPKQVKHRFEIALDIHAADGKDLCELRHRGWRILPPEQVAAHPDAYRKYVQQSEAEFSVAQGIYTKTNSGWFSDRTARYLASGRPALVRDTGFSEHLPVGTGLVSFRTIDEAREGAEKIMGDYDAHRRAARDIAEASFDSDRVIGQVLEQVGAPPAGGVASRGTA